MCRKSVYLVLLLAVVAGITQVAQAQLITSVVRTGSTAGTPRIASPFQEDAVCFVDRAHQYNELPPALPELVGAEYVMTANDDKGNSTLTHQVTISRPATVYLILDNRLGGTGGGYGVAPNLAGMPWVATMGFVDTGYDIGIDEAGDGDIDQWSSLFKAGFPAGMITLGGNTQGHGGNMYGVAAVSSEPQLKAWGPNPPDGTKNVKPSRVEWKKGDTAVAHNVYFGTDQAAVEDADTSSPEWKKLTTDLYFLVGSLLTPATDFYWRIDEIEGDGVTTHKGDIWSFTTMGMKSYNPSPPNGARWIDPDVTLSWSAGFKAKTVSGQDVYLGTDQTAVTNATTSNPMGVFVKTQTTLNYKPTSSLARDIFYYWRIDQRNTDGTITKGDVWRFKTAGIGGGLRADYYHWSGTAPPTDAFYNFVLSRIDPQVNFNWGDPGSPDPLVNVDQFSSRWIGEVESAFTETHTFYTRTDDGVRLWVNDQLLINRWVNQSATEWSGTIDLVEGERYSIVMEYYENTGGAVAELRWSSPSTPKQLVPQGALSPPLRATRPNPPDGATDVVQQAILSWVKGDKAVKHNVYFGTAFDDVSNATTSTAGTYKGQYDVNSYDPPGLLTLGETYYWRVDEVNGIDLWKGKVWSFTVTNYFVVEDYERYTNTSPDIIWQTWIAGGGGKAGYNDPNYAEVTAVHGGRQSMPFDYGNLNPPNYSEATRTFTTPQDWSAQGIKALSLWLRGYPLSVGSFIQSAPGTYTMTAGGTDINDVPDLRHPSFYHDEFHYAYTQVSGNCLIIAKIESVSNTNAWAKAGVMVRSSTDANSPHAMMCITPGNGVAFQYREVTGGHSTTTNQTGITTPYWVAIERQGSTFYGAYSPDGLSWTPRGQMTITMTDPVCIGLSLTACNAAATCTAVFSNVSINQSPPSLTSRDIGIKSNTAAPLYVILQDSKQNTAMVTTNDPNLLLNTTWREWNIALSSFAGVDKSVITKLTIGVGTHSVSTGTIYVDDIRLYLQRCIPNLVKPLADFTNDCLVDYADLAIMTGDWLEHDSTRTGQLQLHWALNEGSGSTVTDSSGKGHTGNIYGATWMTPGYNGSGACLDFNGVGNYVVNNDVNVALNSLDGLSVCAWIRSDLDNTDKGFIIFEDPIGNDSRDMRYDAAGGNGGGTNVMKVGITATDGEQKIESSSNVQKIGVWQHVAIVWASGQNLRLYIDGVLNTPTYIEATRSGTLTGYTRLIAGKGCKDTAADQSWDGLIDDVRIYNYALSQAEIAAVMSGQTLPPVQIYYPVPSPANIYDAEPPNSKSVNLKDYALLADMWLEELLWPQ
jgi:hypothetical protein